MNPQPRWHWPARRDALGGARVFAAVALVGPHEPGIDRPIWTRSLKSTPPKAVSMPWPYHPAVGGTHGGKPWPAITTVAALGLTGTPMPGPRPLHVHRGDRSRPRIPPDAMQPLRRRALCRGRTCPTARPSAGPTVTTLRSHCGVHVRRDQRRRKAFISAQSLDILAPEPPGMPARSSMPSSATRFALIKSDRRMARP